MPYVVRKRKGKKCVYKKKKNGKPGEKVGCTDGPIKDYLTALHINANEGLEDKTMKISKQKLERIIKEEVAREMRMRKRKRLSEAEDIDDDPYAHEADASYVDYQKDPGLQKLAGQIVDAFLENPTNPDLEFLVLRGSEAVGLLGRGSIDDEEAFETLMMYISDKLGKGDLMKMRDIAMKAIRDEVDDMLSYAEPT